MVAPALPAPDRSRDARIAGSVAALVVAVILIANLAPGTPRPAPSPASDPTCREWTDGCSVCIRDGDATGCTTPGIACTRGPAACTRR
ncbi:hypothetical protein [Methylobacterium sp. JK268]